MEEVDVAGPPTAVDVRAAGWAEAAVLRASLTDEPDTVVAPNGAVASATIDSGGVHVHVRCGDPLDEVVLRSYCTGAAHMALGWVRSEGIAVDEAGVPVDLTIRSFGILRAADTPAITVEIEPDDGPPVNGSDAVFAASPQPRGGLPATRHAGLLLTVARYGIGSCRSTIVSAWRWTIRQSTRSKRNIIVTLSSWYCSSVCPCTGRRRARWRRCRRSCPARPSPGTRTRPRRHSLERARCEPVALGDLGHAGLSETTEAAEDRDRFSLRGHRHPQRQVAVEERRVRRFRALEEAVEVAPVAGVLRGGSGERRRGRARDGRRRACERVGERRTPPEAAAWRSWHLGVRRFMLFSLWRSPGATLGEVVEKAWRPIVRPWTTTRWSRSSSARRIPAWCPLRWPRASPARRLRDAIEPIAMHSVWSRRTNERLHGLGLDFLGSYVWGRAAALGEPDAGVVVSSFAVFEPGMLDGDVRAGSGGVPARRDAGRPRRGDDRQPPRDARRCRRRAGRRPARRRPCRRRTRRVGRCSPGWPTQAWPSEPVGRLWRACELAREHRGDSHVAACVVDGLDPIAMNVLTEVWVGMPLGSYSATRGWSQEQIAATAACAPRRRDCSTATSSRLPAAPAATAWRPPPTPWSSRSSTPSGADLEAVIAQLDEWSAACIAAGAFPPDAFKRAAG